MRIIDFTDIDLYPRRYRILKDSYAFIYSLIIENIERQKEKLISKKSQLLIGDAIEVNLTFGHNFGTEEKEEWKDFHIFGTFVVEKIIPHPSHNQIELVVRKWKRSPKGEYQKS